MYICLHVKYQLFSSDFNETLIFSTHFLKNVQTFMKIRPVGAELFHAENPAPTPGFKTRTFQPVMRRNTDFAIPSPQNYCIIVDNL